MRKIMALILITAFFIAGCKRPADEVSIVLDWTVNTNHTGLYVALHEGFFSEQGLRVSIEPPPESGAVTLAASGSAEFAVSYQEEVTYSRLAGLPIRAIAAVIQHNTSGFASRVEAGITSPLDFEGKRYGGWGSPMEEAVLKALMGRYGADYSKVSNVAVGSMDFFAATEKHVDFTWIFRGWDGVAASIKGIGINYIGLADVHASLDYYTPVIIASEELLQTRPDMVRAFLKATSDGYRFAVENPTKAAEILLEYAPELDARVVGESQRYLADQYVADADRWGEMTRDRWAAFAQWMAEEKLVDGLLDPDAAFTNDFLPQ